jgi:hypothetical protein
MGGPGLRTTPLDLLPLVLKKIEEDRAHGFELPLGGPRSLGTGRYADWRRICASWIRWIPTLLQRAAGAQPRVGARGGRDRTAEDRGSAIRDAIMTRTGASAIGGASISQRYWSGNT